MSHHFQDIAKYWSKIGKCSCPPVANSPVRVTQSEYHLSFWCEKIRNIGLTAVMTEIKSVCDRDKAAAPAGDGVWWPCMSDALTVTVGDTSDEDIRESDNGDSSRGDSWYGDDDDADWWRGGDEHTGRTAAWLGWCEENANEDSGTGGGEALITCDPLDMFANWLCWTSREFSVPVLGDAPTDIVRELVDLRTTHKELHLPKTSTCFVLTFWTHKPINRPVG